MSVEKEPEGKYLDAGGLKLHYHEFGAGFPVICIHGAGPGASGWSNFKGNVEAFAKHYRTILFDMPQFGKSDKPVIKDQRLTFIADKLNAFMAALGIEKAHFIGNFMGGQAALKLAVDYPARDQVGRHWQRSHQGGEYISADAFGGNPKYRQLL